MRSAGSTSASDCADYDYMLRAHGVEMISRRVVDVRAFVAYDEAAANSTCRSLSAYVRGNIKSLRSRQAWLSAGPVDTALLLKPMRKVTQFLEIDLDCRRNRQLRCVSDPADELPRCFAACIYFLFRSR